MDHDVVLVRAVDGKPAKMAAISASKGLVYVAKIESLERVQAGASWPVGFPEEDVFEFEPGAYASLTEAWRSSGAVSREEWRTFNLRHFVRH